MLRVEDDNSLVGAIFPVFPCQVRVSRQCSSTLFHTGERQSGLRNKARPPYRKAAKRPLLPPGSFGRRGPSPTAMVGILSGDVLVPTQDVASFIFTSSVFPQGGLPLRSLEPEDPAVEGAVVGGVEAVGPDVAGGGDLHPQDPA